MGLGDDSYEMQDVSTGKSFGDDNPQRNRLRETTQQAHELPCGQSAMLNIDGMCRQSW